MDQAIHQFVTGLFAMIPIALGVTVVAIVGIVYLQSYFQTTRRPTMWKNL